MKFLSSTVGVIAAAGPVLGASLQAVTSFGANPSSIQVFNYVPDKLAAKPAIVVAVSAYLSPYHGDQPGWRIVLT